MSGMELLAPAPLQTRADPVDRDLIAEDCSRLARGQTRGQRKWTGYVDCPTGRRCTGVARVPFLQITQNPFRGSLRKGVNCPVLLGRGSLRPGLWSVSVPQVKCSLKLTVTTLQSALVI